jgi:excinuclease ABC subunit C
VRRRETFASALDTIPGIGPRRKRALLRQFGSVTAIKEATVVELATTTGMTRSLARKIKEQL